jgi:hypothetical protein
VSANPINATDPSGRFSIEDAIGVVDVAKDAYEAFRDATDEDFDPDDMVGIAAGGIAGAGCAGLVAATAFPTAGASTTAGLACAFGSAAFGEAMQMHVQRYLGTD